MRGIVTVAAAGLVCGVLDGIAAVALSGGRALRVFQYIASGLLGPIRAFRGGVKTALLGLALHFLIALVAAAVYFVASRRLRVLVDSALVAGVVYGAAVHVFMSFVVMPLSAVSPRPFDLRSFVLYLIVHMIVVGPSIALTVRYLDRQAPSR
jgi:hypothetical protein